MPKVKISKDAKLIAQFCDGIGVQFIRVAQAIRNGADPELITDWDSDDLDSYFLSIYGELMALMAAERVISTPIGV